MVFAGGVVEETTFEAKDSKKIPGQSQGPFFCRTDPREAKN